tara:strand:+ start:982 stop:1614 length:633 start_codon:yes stop_codon:yes gene_type:complete
LPVLCLLTDSVSFRNTSKLKRNITEAVEGGVNFLIIRDEDHDLTFLKGFVNDLKKNLPTSIPISINVGLSKTIPQGIKSIHLPEKSQLHENDYEAIVGRSVHSLESALLAEKRGADYLIAGTIYPTNTHPNKLPEGLSLIKSITSKVRIPVFAIGGISSDNIIPVLESGASGISVISSILHSENPKLSAKNISNILKENYNFLINGKKFI